MASKPKLKPCPFCGGEAQLLRISKSPNGLEEWFVSCGSDSCDLYPHSTIPYASAEIAAAAWNRRAADKPSNAAAMRETLAEDRKRSKYERLHECFWDKRAVQCVVRQMLDERDDLSSIDPVSANRMEYFANQLIGAARDGNSVGNAAAMREALCEIVLLTVKAGKSISCDVACGIIASKAKHALKQPPRNCDRYSHDEALSVWAAEKENGKNGCFDEWLYAPATEQKGASNGSK